MTCPCAFRLCRLAQSAGRGQGIHLAYGILPVSSPMNSINFAFLWHVHLHFDCAGSHKTVVLVRRSCGDPGDILSKGSLHADLAGAMSYSEWSSCTKIVWAPLDLHSPAAAGDDVQPHVLLFHSYCCWYLVHWIPTPHIVWGLLPM